MDHDFKQHFGADDRTDEVGKRGHFATTGANPLPNEEIGESQFKLSTLTKTTNVNYPTHGTGPQRTI